MRLTLPELLAILSRELEMLAELTSGLQDRLSAGAYLDPDLQAFQGLDSLTQTLQCLTAYVARVGALTPCRCEVGADAAVDGICLSALADRLRGHAQPNETVVGDAELF